MVCSGIVKELAVKGVEQVKFAAVPCKTLTEDEVREKTLARKDAVALFPYLT